MVKWETTTIGELLEFKNGLNKGKEFFGKGTLIVNYMDVYKHRRIHAEQLRGRVTLDADEIKRFAVRKGDVFFTRTSETPEEVGYASVMLDDIGDCVFSGFVLRGRPITDKLVVEYCQYAFMTENIRKAVMSGCTYTTRALTNGKQLSAIEIQLPDKSEQQRIAEALSDTNALITEMEKLIAKKRAIKQGAMQELLTGKRRLPGFNGEWKYTTIGTEFDLFAGGDLNKECFSQSMTSVYKYKIYANSLQDNGFYGYTSIPRYKGDSITITGRGDVGVAMYREHDFDAIVRLLVLTPKKKKNVDSKFFCYFTNQVIEFSLESTGVPQLTVPQIRNIEVKIPNKSEQTAIAEILSGIDAEIDKLTVRLNKLKNIKQGMMSELLTGKIRLIEEGMENGEN